MSRGTIVEEIPGDELDEIRIVEAIVRGPGLSKAGRSPLGVAMPKAPGSQVAFMTTSTRADAARQQMPQGRSQRPRQEQVAQVDQGPALDAGRPSDPVAGRAGLVHRVAFPGFVNASNINQILILALPLIVATIAQTHALLVGYLDLSVGAMISLGVVIASFLIGAEATGSQILIGIGVILLCGLALGLVNAGLIRGVKIPSIIATLATLSILDGISLTLRPTAQGTISGDLVSFLTTSIGPIPVAFIIVVVRRCPARCLASRLGIRSRGAGGWASTSGRRSVAASGPTGSGSAPLLLSASLAAAASFFVMARAPTGNASVGSTFALSSITAAVLGGASLAGGRATFVGGLVASILLAVILTVLPYLGLSNTDGLMIVGVLVLIGIILFQFGDIKELVKRNYRRARRVMLGSRPPKAAELPAFYPAGTDFRVVPTDRVIIENGIVLSLDRDVGDFQQANVVIEGDKIVGVGPGLNGSGEKIDATGMIVMPGFVDSHRHIWEGVLRNIGTDVPLEGRTSYISFVLHKLAPAFRPEDAYAGDLVSALGAIDAGITTLLDWSHIQASPAHTDAVIQALEDSGIRAVFAYGFPWWGKWEERQPSWFVRAATEHFSIPGPEADPGPGRTGSRVHRLRGVAGPLEAGQGDRGADQHPCRGRLVRAGLQGPGDG